MNDSNSTFRRFIYILLAFLCGVFVAFFIKQKQQKLDSSKMNKLQEIMYYIDNYYVDTVNNDLLMKNAINGMLENLDPHSSYSDIVESAALKEDLDGAFEGVGIQFNIMNDTVMVVATISGGPSERSGIRAGDRIVSVNGENIAGVHIDNAKVMKLLRGKKGTKVEIGIARIGLKKTLSFDVKRDVIPTYTVNIAYMINPTTGYIKIDQFGSTTAQEFSDAILKLKSKGMQKMILDLRGNPGGYLQAAIKVCDEFLKKDEMILYVEGIHTKTEEIFATRYGNFEKGKVVVLIDEFSASASEILAGAIQDNDRGYIVGRRSFGKGLVQQQIDLSDGSSIRLTISRYHIPSGRCIQKEYKEGITAYYDELIKRYENGEMDSATSIHFNEKMKFQTKKGRVVYGGGGIMPDYFIPIDKGSDNADYLQLINSGELIQFAFNYTNSHLKELKKVYPNAERYVKDMEVSDGLMNEYLTFYRERNKKTIPVLNTESKRELKMWIKALIGRNLYKEEAFYPILNKEDKMVLKALGL